MGPWGGLDLGGLAVTGARVYDSSTGAFLSPDPLEAVTGVGWAGNPYSWAGGDPVGGGTDPLGLRPVSEADMRVYQQASNGHLANAAAAVGSWVADNWEYLAAGAMVVAGVAVMCTGVGGPIGAAMISGALISAGSSAGIQKFTTGGVDWGKVAVDGAVGAVAGLAGGAAGAAAGRAAQGASCMGRNVLTGAAESAADGAVSGGLGYLTGPGPHTVGGLAAATVGGGAGGGVMGGAGGALSKTSGVARYGCFTADTGVLMADGTTSPSVRLLLVTGCCLMTQSLGTMWLPRLSRSTCTRMCRPSWWVPLAVMWRLLRLTRSTSTTEVGYQPATSDKETTSTHLPPHYTTTTPVPVSP